MKRSKSLPVAKHSARAGGPCHESTDRSRRRICFVTGTRAEFGLMESTLRAIRDHPKLKLQIVATGMHLVRRHGRTLDGIGFDVDAKVPWSAGKSTPSEIAQSTGRAISLLANTFDRLSSDIVLIVGDRVEAFAAASAAHLSGRIVAHIHGGDRALGQVDDSLRHAITKLSHLHFAATKQSAARILKLGEDRWRIHTVGAPGIDGITEFLTPSPGTPSFAEIARWKGRGEGSRKSRYSSRSRLRQNPHPNPLPAYRARGQEQPFALLILHPIESDDLAEYRRAKLILRATQSVLPRVLIIHPNNDPGSRGIARCWDELADDPRIEIHRNLDRPGFLRLLATAAVLVGNSSSGIIEAASFGTPAIDIGPRQLGRQRSGNVTNVPYRQEALLTALRSIWNDGRPVRFTGANVYGGKGTGQRIANVLSSTPLNDRLRRKLISY